MGSSLKQSWKLQEFVAHGANVNCLAMGHKSNQVLVTGGDDKKVNLWAIGRHSCLLSLSGHVTPVESVCFGHSEDIVCAGSQTGSLKIWDLEAPKLLRTLTGHKGAIKCMDFHPYGDYLTSGSQDRTIKFWDIRKKGCIFTYADHDMAINSVQFSPDGQWLVSGGEDGYIKVWDVRVGKVLKVFRDHSAAVTCVRFHPHEFLLASCGVDKVVNFWDMEKFQLVSTIAKENSPIRFFRFSDDGTSLLGAATDGLKVIGWEPSHYIDSISAQWGQIHDMTVVHKQLILGWFHSTNVILNVVDLSKVRSLTDSNGGTHPTNSSPFQKSSTVRKSFSKDRPPKQVSAGKKKVDPQIVEESTSGTEPEEEPVLVPNFQVYEEIFRPSRALNRTPPASTSTLNSPEGSLGYPDRTPSPTARSLSLKDLQSTGTERTQISSPPASLPSETANNPYVPTLKPVTPPQRHKADVSMKYMSQEKYKSDPLISNEDSTKSPRTNFGMYSPPVERSSQLGIPNCRLALRRQHSHKEIVRNSHSGSEEGQNFRSFGQNTSMNFQNSMPDRVQNSNRHSDLVNMSFKSTATVTSNSLLHQPQAATTDREIFPSIDDDKMEFVPSSTDKPVGLDLDEFLPRARTGRGGTMKGTPEPSDQEVLGVIMRGHEPMMVVLSTRQRSLQLFNSMWMNKNLKLALESAIAVNEISVLVDILGALVLKPSVWTLDICALLLPKVSELLQSKYESYMSCGCTTLRLILRNFSSVIKTNVNAPVRTLGVDIPREERYNKSLKCYNTLVEIRSFLLKRQTMQGRLGAAFRDLHSLIQQGLED